MAASILCLCWAVMDLFSVERVARALGTPVVAVELVEPLQAGANQVARLDVRFPDLRGPSSALRVIGKAGRGAAVAGLQRERWFQIGRAHV